MAIRTVLFDLDGTIVDTNELIIQTFLHVLQDRKPEPLTREQVIPHMGKTLSDQLRLFSGQEDVEKLIEDYRDFNTRMHDELAKEFPYVREVMGKLHEHGIRMGIVTTKMRNTTIMGLKLCGLEQYVETIVSLEDVSHPKPHPEPVLLALDRLGAVAEETVMVGDSPFDIEAANSAGVISIGVGWSLKGAEQLRTFNPRYIIDDMRELLAITGIEAGADRA